MLSLQNQSDHCLGMGHIDKQYRLLVGAKVSRINNTSIKTSWQ